MKKKKKKKQRPPLWGGNPPAAWSPKTHLPIFLGRGTLLTPVLMERTASNAFVCPIFRQKKTFEIPTDQVVRMV